MKHSGFLTVADRQVLTALARDGLAEHRLARRANALVLLDRGMSCAQVARVLLLDDDTIRTWRDLFEKDGIGGLAGFHFGGRQAFLSTQQEARLKAWVSAQLPRTTREVGAWIEQHCGVIYESRSGLIKLLHRLGFEHRTPRCVSAMMDPDRQRQFIAAYEKLLNRLAADEAVMFADAVHPTYGAHPVGCWAPKDRDLAVAQTTHRQHLNIHGAVNLETGDTTMLEALSVDAASTIRLLRAIEDRYPNKRRIHVFADNAKYHRSPTVRAWLNEPGRKIWLHFVPPYCPHLNPIERLWGAMHRAVTHNRCAATFDQFCRNILYFLTKTVPKQWPTLRDAVSDNFRVIDPDNFRILT